MTTATRTGPAPRFRDAGEMRELLDRVLTEVDGDEKAGPLLRATGMRMRLRCPDLDVDVNIGASEDPAHYVEWSFEGDPPWKPKLELTMDSATANEFLQGQTSIPVAIARGQVQANGDARSALLYLPATKLITDSYRRLVAAEYQHLAL
jgi:hypothetical protein